MKKFSDSPSPAALGAAIALLGAPAVPLRAAAERLAWPCQSKPALHRRLVAGTLPLPPRRLSGRWFVLAVDLAVQLSDPEAFGRSDVQIESAAPAAAPRRPGRPRKQAGSAA